MLNLLVINDLTWCDRPVADRPRNSRSPDFASPSLTRPRQRPGRTLDPEQLARLADAALITPALSGVWANSTNGRSIDLWSMNQLIEPVAVSLFIKEAGHPPASPG